MLNSQDFPRISIFIIKFNIFTIIFNFIVYLIKRIIFKKTVKYQILLYKYILLFFLIHKRKKNGKKL